MKEYVYYCKMRPPGPGTVPTRGLQRAQAFDERHYVPVVDCMAWGLVSYREPLTPREIADFELISAPREGST